MQQLISRLGRFARRRANRPPRTAGQQHRLDIRWGVLGIVSVIVAATAIGVASTVELGATTYTAHLTDAGALRPGDEVRLAGITVGAVKSLELRSDHVDLAFTVDDKVFVGAQTTLDVRMLTVVGGHYLALLPAGREPLGRTAIPADRVLLPYSLPQAFQDAVAPVRAIDGEVLRRNFGALADAADHSPDGLRRMLGAVDSLVGILDKQNADVSRSLDVADEYLTALARNRAVLGRFIQTFRLLETMVADTKSFIGEALRNLAQLLGQAAPLAREWNTTLKPMAQSVTDAIPSLEELDDRLGTLLTAVQGLGQRLQALIGPNGTISIDQSGTTVSAPALCIPIPGRSC
ncbi:MlaD family protein [Nocardia huaxiensis]|uniref:MlaD family protein n=1 Tax=Nocardia huaxiensis TaxID=2755382 RepID=UPI001E52A968|nr:MlaD family protein [Nocardia huaxiensis]UFS98542.1 MlaD family protein [Nocardia huaxiensis]